MKTLTLDQNQIELLQEVLHEKEYALKRYCDHLGSQKNFELRNEVEKLVGEVEDLLGSIGRKVNWKRAELVDFDLTKMYLDEARRILKALDSNIDLKQDTDSQSFAHIKWFLNER